VELFGQTHFPAIGELPYLLTLGPHAVYWLAIEGPREEEAAAPADELAPAIYGAVSLDALVAGKGRGELERALARFLPTRRWFGGKARRIRSVSLVDALPLAGERAALPARVIIARVDFIEGEPETYAIPLILLEGDRAERTAADAPRSVVARIERRGESAVLADALTDPDVCRALLDAVRRRRRLRGPEGGRLAGRPAPALRDILGGEDAPEPAAFRADQSNTSVIFGQSLILKLFRRVEDGVNPDLELGRHLAERARFAHTPRVAGALEYQQDGGEPATLAILHEFAPNEGDAWQYTLDALGRFAEEAVTDRIRPGAQPPEPAPAGLLERARAPIPEEVDEVVGSYLQSAQLMGRRLAELHAALTGDGGDAALAPEPVTPHYQRSVYQSARNLTGRTMQLLRRRLPSLGERERAEAEALLARDGEVLRRFAALIDRRVRASRIRIHGDLHLGQVLFTGRDFLIIDFEGEPARSLSERRTKRTPLRDVAGLLRSFDYASVTALLDAVARGLVEADSDAARELDAWMRHWRDGVSAAFLGSYLEAAGDAPWIPADPDALALVLDTALLEKAIYELAYELNNRPDRVAVPLRGIRDLLDGGV
jgi:maltose alpha-D-glucosyltransferase/alpha-amylase